MLPIEVTSTGQTQLLTIFQMDHPPAGPGTSVKGLASMAIRVLIADDHEVVRQGLKTFLSIDPDLKIVGEAEDGAEAVEQARELRPDVVLMDLLMPRMDGLTATRMIRTELPEIEVIALTSVLEDGSIGDALRAGAMGYL